MSYIAPVLLRGSVLAPVLLRGSVLYSSCVIEGQCPI